LNRQSVLTRVFPGLLRGSGRITAFDMTVGSAVLHVDQDTASIPRR